jgi:hypothetical protein
MNPEAFQIFLGVTAASAGAILGFFLCALLTRGQARDAERRAWREAEKLQRARAIADLRDRTSARL